MIYIIRIIGNRCIFELLSDLTLLLFGSWFGSRFNGRFNPFWLNKRVNLSSFPESKGLKNMPECFVTLDKYRNDLARYVARDKLIKERFMSILNGSCLDSSKCSLGFRDELFAFYDFFCQPIGMFFTQQEWSQPVAASRCKFSSVADGVQTHLEFEGER